MDEDTREFLLTEFDLLKDSKQSQIQQEESRFSYFLVFLSALMATTSLIIVDKNSFPASLIAALTLLGFLIGYMTFLRIVHAHINATKYSRGLNRIRNYFVKNDPNFEKIADELLILPRSADQPKLGEFGVGIGKPWLVGLPGLMNIINSVLFGTSVALFLPQYLISCHPITSGVTALTFSYLAHIVNYHYIIVRAKQKIDPETKIVTKKKDDTAHGKIQKARRK